jgi:lipopolysaccharide transport system ATP-binding protein
MSSEHKEDYAIEISGLSKCYQIYEKPIDRLKQMLKIGGKKYFKEFWAINNVSFKIRKGETVGVIGRNGSGKSTLLQMICGTLNPTGGEIVVNGRVAALLELGAGFNPEFSGVENVYMSASLYGLSKEDVDKRFDAIIEFADIGEHIHQPVKTYSSGMYVRLAFAVIAHVDASILVIDEALAVGDAFFTQKCMRFLREFIKNGTILFVSHDTSSIRSLCETAIWLNKGAIVAKGTPKQVCESYLEAFFEENQGKSQKPILKKIESSSKKISKKDQREAFINNSALRNDIEVFKFNEAADSFGKGAAVINSVNLCDSDGNTLSWIVGGECVVLRINVAVLESIASPIIGFHVKDRFGQSLFGDNTFLSYFDNPVDCNQGDVLDAEFHFNMPRLPTGDYSVAAAIADGTQYEHVQHHWIHDAIIFRSDNTNLATGIIGIPMINIKMKKG